MQTKTFKLTYQTRIDNRDKQDETLSKMTDLLSHVERSLFKELQKKDRLSLNELKILFLKKYQITARQFNALRIKLEGKVLSFKMLQSENIQNLESKIRKLKKHLKRLKDKFKLHQKKRRLHILETKLEKLKTDKEENKVRLCFGSKKLFQKQFHLEGNGFKSHEEWKKEWDQARNNSFFLVGSKDETTGNQSCQLVKNEETFTLFVRLPNSFSEKILKIENISFNYGKEQIIVALMENEERKKLKALKKPYKHLGKAINYLFKKDEKGFRIFITIEQDVPCIKTNRKNGAIGLDINANQIALAEIDHFGNLVKKKVLACASYGKNRNQTKAIIQKVAKEIVDLALLAQKPLVLEKLDFTKKKHSLREKNNLFSRILSSFAYRQIIQSIKTKALKEGVDLIFINPAFTSIIGRLKFMFRYGLSTHVSAALTIARRQNHYSEKLPRYLEIKDNKSSKSAFLLPERNRKKHVWSDYKKLYQKLKQTVDVLHVSTIIRSSRPLKLLCDSERFDMLPGKLRYVNSLTELLG